MLRTIASNRLISSVIVRESRCRLSLTTKAMTPFFARFQSTSAVEEKSTESSAQTQALDPATTASTLPPITNEQNNEGARTFIPTIDRMYEFFTNVELTKEGVAVIRFDCPKKVNSISFALSHEAKKLWKNEIENNPGVKAVVFSSAKPDMFIAGADIFDIKRIENKEDLVDLIKDGMDFFKHMRKRKIPLVCAINGPALGGGLEWALWCDYRVCSDSPKTKLGLPEVKLGLLPGFGGTQNLHELVGLQNAMDMMLTGKDIRPHKAKKMGLVDLISAPQSVEKDAIKSAVDLMNGKLKLKKKRKTLVNRILEDTSIGQKVIWNQIDKMIEKNTSGNYPAPYAIIKCVKNGLDDRATRFENERKEFAKLAATKESEALIGIFDGMTQMKKNPFDMNAAMPVNTAAVMGAGLMGAGIAQVTAEKGISVLLKDRNDAAVERGEAYMRENWNKKLKRKRMTKFQNNLNESNVIGLTDDNRELVKKHFGTTDIVIEAVFEDLNLKKKIVADIESMTPDHCVFATNTSAIPIRDIAEGSKRPQNIIGMHFFSPVPSMPLLEIIPSEKTNESTKAAAFNFGTKLGKTCIVVKDVPGFYVNRCLGPFLVEVSALVRDGVSLEKLDKAVKDFGMPVGPVTLADEVGIDVTSHVAKFLSNSDLGVRMEGGDITLMENMISKGWLGKKSGQGFYTYGKKKNEKTISPQVTNYLKDFVVRDLNLDIEEIQNRIISRFVNEAAKCLEDEIIGNPIVGDIGLVFGTGFAPFRGGPFRYLDQFGVAKYVDMMSAFTEKYGQQFEPCQLLKDYATTNKKFHSKQ